MRWFARVAQFLTAFLTLIAIRYAYVKVPTNTKGAIIDDAYVIVKADCKPQ